MGRSPNYPSVDLADSITLVRKLYEKSGRSLVQRNEAVQAWGYNSVNGKSRRLLSALRQYGFINIDKKGVVLSARGLQVAIYPDGDPNQIEALEAAALEPRVFSDIFDSDRAEGSEGTIQNWLIMEKEYNQEAAEFIARAYKANLRLARLDKTEYTPRQDDEDANGEEKQMDHQPGTDQGAPPSQTSRYVYGLGDGLDVEVVFKGRKHTRDDIKLFRAYLALQQRGLRETSKAKGQTEQTDE
ncbi:MAG: hypothetical protein KJ621_14730 [Proteobacteria bacterium]|nr:hypothetical protein [Pseudomonadota bacterium]